jgi:colanic acid/amylovoran biosynthesis glycosyltransferase
MKVAIIVDDYPVLSQAFINRLIDNLAVNENIDIDVVSVNTFDDKKLEIFSKSNYELFRTGNINVRSFSCTNRYKYFLMMCFSFVKYILKLGFGKPNINISSIFKVNIKYHVKAAILSELLGKTKYDILHAQFLSIAIYSTLANNINPSGKIFASGRGSDVSNKTSLLKQEVKILENDVSGVSKYLFVSRSLMDIAIDKGISLSKSSVLYSGIDVSNINFKKPKSASSDSKIRLIQVGRLVEKKGILLTLEVFKSVRSKVVCCLTVVGDGDLYSTAYERAKELGILEDIEFVGAQNNRDCLKLINSSDILLVPSLTGRNGDAEGIPNVAKEAMAIGCIVVSSDHSGLKELVFDGVNGFVFEENNIQHFQEKLELAIQSRNDWLRIAVNARLKIETDFSIEKVGGQMLTNYNEFVS